MTNVTPANNGLPSTAFSSQNSNADNVFTTQLLSNYNNQLPDLEGDGGYQFVGGRTNDIFDVYYGIVKDTIAVDGGGGNDTINLTTSDMNSEISVVSQEIGFVVTQDSNILVTAENVENLFVNGQQQTLP
jgi:hypothetical protein